MISRYVHNFSSRRDSEVHITIIPTSRRFTNTMSCCDVKTFGNVKTFGTIAATIYTTLHVLSIYAESESVTHRGRPPADIVHRKALQVLRKCVGRIPRIRVDEGGRFGPLSPVVWVSQWRSEYLWAGPTRAEKSMDVRSTKAAKRDEVCIVARIEGPAVPLVELPSAHLQGGREG